jgi:molybdopterin molybdotransferase
MITVTEAESIIQATVTGFGSESIAFEAALGRVLAADLRADRDLPPVDRSTADGIAVRYSAIERGLRRFTVKDGPAAGDSCLIEQEEDCMEICAGAALPPGADTVIDYRDLDMEAERVSVKDAGGVKKGQKVQGMGRDRRKDDVVLPAGRVIGPVEIGMAASIGATRIEVKRIPRVTVISTGNEMVDIGETPSPYKVRRSNPYTLRAVLQSYGIFAQMVHLSEEGQGLRRQLGGELNDFDVILLTGCVARSKFDYLPRVLRDLAVQPLFEGVRQNPGKGFWFGTHPGGVLVFAFPGNPVSAFLCLHRYFLPWLEASLGIPGKRTFNARLSADVTFTDPFRHFLKVRLRTDDNGQRLATPVNGNGSDFANMVCADAFMELPAEQASFREGSVHKVWPFRSLHC